MPRVEWHYLRAIQPRVYPISAKIIVWRFDGRMAFVPEGPAVWTFSCAFPSAPEGRTETAQGFSPGKVRGLALPKQDRIMLPVGLDILGRPKGENRIAHGLQPWDSMAFQSKRPANRIYQN